MAIGTPVVLVAAYTTTDTTTYTVTPSPAPTRGRLLVCFSDTSHATLTAPTSTPTGLGLDWTHRITQAHPTDVRIVFAHTAPVHAGLTTGNVTLTMTGANLPSTGTGFALMQISGVDLANPIVRAVGTNVNSTSITLTLPKPLSVANRWLVWKSHRANEVTTPRAAPWVELSDVAGASPTRSGEVQWLPGVVTSTGILETAASASWATSGQASIIALELRAAQDRYAVFFGDTPQATVTQAAYRFYADGTETGASALAAQDTSYSANIGAGDVNLQTRIRLQGTNTVATSSGDDWQLQYEKNASGTWTDVIAPPVLADSNTTNTTSGSLLSGQTGVAQSFVGNGQNLSKVRFLLNRVSTPDGTVTAVLYAHSGTYGTSSVPTGAALASSSTFLTSSSITASPTNTWYDFDFDGTFTLGNGTNYCIAVISTNSTANAVNVRSSANGGVHHAGNASTFSGSWSASATTDRAFELYTGSPITPSNVIPYDSASLTEAEATTNRLGAGTGSFVAGKASEDGLVDNLGWTASNYTELLYSLTLVADDLADGDDLLFRVKRNDVADLTYTVTPTLAITVGATPVTGTAAVTLANATSTVTVVETIRGSVGAADYFERADGPLGANWVTVGAPFAIVSGRAVGSSSSANMHWLDTFGQDMANEVDVELGAHSAEIDLGVRATQTGVGILGGWYSTGASTGDYYLDAATLNTTAGAAPGSNITLRLEVTATTARLLADGVEVLSGSAGASSGSLMFVGDAGTNPSPIEAWRATTVTLANFTSTATGTVGNATGTVAVTLAAFTSTATGLETISGTSAQTLADYTSTAAGTVTAPVTGTVAQTLADFTSTASGTHTVTITGTGTVTLAAFTSTATGVETITGSSAQTLAAFTSTASGTETITGTSAQTLAAFTSTATGLETITGTVAQTLAGHTSTASGIVAVAVTGTSAQTLADFTSTTSGIVQQNVTGTAAVTLADHTSTAAGVETITGTSAQTLAAFTSTATGLETITGTSAQTLAAFTSTAAGLETITGTSAQTLADFTSTASGVVQTNITGTAATTLAGHTSTATGAVINPITGTGAVTLADHTSTATGVETITGTSAQTLEPFTSTATGTVLTPIVGTVAVTLEDFFTTTTAAPIIATYGPLIRAARPATIQRTRPVVVTMRRPEDADRDRPVTVELARPGVT